MTRRVARITLAACETTSDASFITGARQGTGGQAGIDMHATSVGAVQFTFGVSGSTLTLGGLTFTRIG